MQNGGTVQDEIALSMIRLCDDGYIRLTFKTLLDTTLFHFLSGLYDDCLGLSGQGATVTEVSGYTEWITHTTPSITIGWDWHLTTSFGELRCIRVGLPRSNVMLLDNQQRDLGLESTESLLGTLVDMIAWSNEALDNIYSRYV